MGRTLELWDVDDIGGHDLIGRIHIAVEGGGAYPFCCGSGGSYDLGIIA